MDCRNLGYMDVYRLPSMALDTGFPVGMTVYLTFVYNKERSAWERYIFTLPHLKLVAALLGCQTALSYYF